MTDTTNSTEPPELWWSADQEAFVRKSCHDDEYVVLAGVRDLDTLPSDAVHLAPEADRSRTLAALLDRTIAAELDRQADEIRAEAGDPGNGWRPNETYRAQKIFTKLRDRAGWLRATAYLPPDARENQS